MGTLPRASTPSNFRFTVCDEEEVFVTITLVTTALVAAGTEYSVTSDAEAAPRKNCLLTVAIIHYPLSQ